MACAFLCFRCNAVRSSAAAGGIDSASDCCCCGIVERASDASWRVLTVEVTSGVFVPGLVCAEGRAEATAVESCRDFVGSTVDSERRGGSADGAAVEEGEDWGPDDDDDDDGIASCCASLVDVAAPSSFAAAAAAAVAEGEGDEVDAAVVAVAVADADADGVGIGGVVVKVVLCDDNVGLAVTGGSSSRDSGGATSDILEETCTRPA